jgi:hypothetical protein
MTLIVDDSSIDPASLREPGHIQDPTMFYIIRLLARGQEAAIMAFANEIDAQIVADKLNQAPREDEGTFHVTWMRMHRCVPEKYR